MARVALAIVGTRILGCKDDYRRSKARIERALSVLHPEIFVSGGAVGIDSLAESIARDLGYNEKAGTLIVHKPTTRKFQGPGGYAERNERIAEDCTHLLRLSCFLAETYGSAWTAQKARMLNRVVVDEVICSNPRW